MKDEFERIYLHLEISKDGSKIELIRARYIDEKHDCLVNLRLDTKAPGLFDWRSGKR